MLKKNYTKTGQFCRVTFKVPPDVGARKIMLCGDFNDWNKHATAMKPLKDGSFSVTITLPANTSYRFKYYLGTHRWENDWDADGYIRNDFGSEDSLLKL
jgi:1,4-alpha-glucan branching enzyme